MDVWETLCRNLHRLTCIEVLSDLRFGSLACAEPDVKKMIRIFYLLQALGRYHAWCETRPRYSGPTISLGRGLGASTYIADNRDGHRPCEHG